MFFENQRCTHCNSEDIFKLPSDFSLNQDEVTNVKSKKPGKIVHEYIEDTKRALKKEKKDLTSREI